MSGQGDNRWRTSNAHHRNNPSRGGSGTSTPQQQQQQGQQRGFHTKNQSRNQNNANFADRSRSASGARGPGQGKGSSKAGSPATPNPGQMQLPQFNESHVPVKSFNRDEVKDFLKSQCDGSREATPYKAGKGAEGSAPSGPWATTPRQMASGQNFFVQLSKQIAAQGQGG